MKTEQFKWSIDSGWKPGTPSLLGKTAQLVFVFGSTSILKEKVRVEEVQERYPNAIIFGCSTSGEICCTQVNDETLVVTAIEFKYTKIKCVQTPVNQANDSFDVGIKLVDMLDKEDLSHVFVLSDGLSVNGSELVNGLVQALPENVTLTGGLAGDGSNFKETYVILNKSIETKSVALVGFYGQNLKIGFGSLGGWDSFGPQRLVTKSKGNVLFELDGHSALGLYKNYLGEHANNLPASGLLFPLSLRIKTADIGVVRTILSVDEMEQSMTFAGDIPEGAYTQLMKANFDRLIDGAIGAARISYEAIGSNSPDLAILISCVGRKLVLKQRVEEEIEGAREVLGENVVLTGFYSYGEISPFTPNAKCELHNQTMTITTFREE